MDIITHYAELKSAVNQTIDRQELYVEKRRSISHDDKVCSFDIVIYPLLIENRKGAVLRLDEVTEYVNMEKLSSIGSMAAGMAHDFNNLLTPIMGFCELMLMDLDEGTEMRSHAEQIRDAGRKSSDLVGQLLSFSRQLSQEYRQIDLDGIIKLSMNLLRRAIREDIGIILKLDDTLEPISGDKGQIEQILMNLALNSQFAMAEGGRLTIGTEKRVIAREEEAYSEMKAGAYSVLVVTDTGEGMDEENQKHIFDPFFTTKGNEGTGLGLASIYGIVKQHGGYIWLYSEKNMGTTFKISFPVINDENPTGGEMTPGKEKMATGSETILIAEDSGQVKDLAQAILPHAGFKTIAVNNGSEAIDMIRSMKERDEAVHLILSDIIMPEMNGQDLFKEARIIMPDLKVIFMSGYPGDSAYTQQRNEALENFIQKPFSLYDLTDKIRAVLDSPPTHLPISPGTLGNLRRGRI